MERIFTIGAYGWEGDRFFDALQEAGVDLFLDIRRRRGVRGREYAFANATRLQEELARRGIRYRHVLDLSPDDTTRALQHRADQAGQVPRRQRRELSDEFVADYRHRTLEIFDWEHLIPDLEGARRPVLFCVERVPEACHRGLVAQHLAAAMHVPVADIVP